MTVTVLLDKDGTLVDDVPYNVDPALIRLAPSTHQGLAMLTRTGCRLAVVTNQSGVARGYFPESAIAGVEARLRELIAPFGATLDGFYYCPHLPDGTIPEYAVDCTCRKPRPGLIERAAAELGAAPDETWMVGDILDDVEAGNRAGCRTILIDNGHETEWRFGPFRRPRVLVQDFAAAARVIVAAACAPRVAGREAVS